MKKNILIVANTLDIGGIERSLISLLQSIDFNKYNVDLLIKSGGIFQKYIPSEVNIIESPEFYKWIFLPKKNIINAFIGSIGLNLNFMRFIFYISKGLIIKNMGKARQQLMESCIHALPSIDSNYDVAIDYTGGLKSLVINKIKASKKITWVHSDYRVYKRDKNIDMIDYSKVDAIISVSKTCNDIFVSEFPQYKDKCYIMPNITNKEQILKMSNEEVDFDNNYTGLKILDITRLDPNKGLDIAVKACEALINEGYDIKWYVLGEGPERLKLEELIRSHNLEEKFNLLGVKTNPYPFIKNTDIVVHCSLFEGRSVAIDEAMLLAKPIILTDYPTAKDQINNQITGLICKTSVNGVYNAVKLLIEEIELRNKLIENLLQYEISINYSLNILEGIINGED